VSPLHKKGNMIKQRSTVMMPRNKAANKRLLCFSLVHEWESTFFCIWVVSN